MKKITLIFIIMISLLLCSCEEMTDEEKKELYQQRQERIENTPKYEYEQVHAEIVDIKISRMFTRLDWYIKLKYDPYNLEYENYGYSVGIWNAPEFYGKNIGETTRVEVCNTYIKGELVKREISRIY